MCEFDPGITRQTDQKLIQKFFLSKIKLPTCLQVIFFLFTLLSFVFLLALESYVRK